MEQAQLNNEESSGFGEVRRKRHNIPSNVKIMSEDSKVGMVMVSSQSIRTCEYLSVWPKQRDSA